MYKNKKFSFSHDKVFIDPVVYQGNFEFLYSVSAYHIGELKEAFQITESLVNMDTLQLDMVSNTLVSLYSLAA